MAHWIFYFYINPLKLYFFSFLFLLILIYCFANFFKFPGSTISSTGCPSWSVFAAAAAAPCGLIISFASARRLAISSLSEGCGGLLLLLFFADEGLSALEGVVITCCC